VPLAVIFLIIWIYKIKRNSEIQVEQNKRIIELLENGKTEKQKNRVISSFLLTGADIQEGLSSFL
jgi:hypothetical protein